MITYNGLLSAFKTISLTSNAVIMVHSSYKSIGGVEGGADSVIDALLEWVGPEGTVIFPTFNFQEWTERHYFDIYETPSKMGIITELARLREDAIRTPHPIYSFAVFGKRREEFGACDDKEAYGEKSVFSLFHELDGVVVSVGLKWNKTFSMHHYVEYKVGCSYRRIKDFSGIYVGSDRSPSIRTYSMFVRNNDRIVTDIREGMDHLFNNGVIKQTTIGSTHLHYSTASNFYGHMSEVVSNWPWKLHKKKEPF